MSIEVKDKRKNSKTRTEALTSVRQGEQSNEVLSLLDKNTNRQ